jgi:hypothetical protein
MNLNMRFKWGWRSHRLSPPPSSCGVRVRHCNGRWCPTDHVLDAECDGVADGWSSARAWRFLLQLRNQRGCTQGFLQYQRCLPAADRGWNQRQMNHKIVIKIKRKGW